MAKPLRLERLSLKNIRCFRDLEIYFREAGVPTLIAGDNGDGKTTLLRCLAMVNNVVGTYT